MWLVLTMFVYQSNKLVVFLRKYCGSFGNWKVTFCDCNILPKRTRKGEKIVFLFFINFVLVPISTVSVLEYGIY